VKNSDALALLREICAVERKHHRFYTEKEVQFINMVKEPINNGKPIGTQTGKELERIYRKSQGG
jgi:hypothetical protein